MDKIAAIVQAFGGWDLKDWIWFTLDAVVFTGGVCLILFVLGKVLKALKPVIGKDGIKINPDTVVESVEAIQKKLYEEHQKVIETQNAAMNEANSNQHFMDEDNRENDEHLKQRCQERTVAMRLKFKNDLSELIPDKTAVSAVCVNFRATFGNAIIRNHFTKELMPDRIQTYRARILGEVREEYIALHLDDRRIPPVSEVEKIINNFVDEWLSMMKDETVACCEEKIKVYKDYRPRFGKVSFMVEVVDSRIRKNENYIKQLKS
ncbi:MAG: hypothetical protein LBK61_05310 [Spirochaetaceae bacterium]|jgi:hypothetical protein|nr:hypothetical protein [Spirochaetaceae bacterium]